MALFARGALALVVLTTACGGNADMGAFTDAGAPGVSIKFALQTSNDAARLPAKLGDVEIDDVSFWIDKMTVISDRGGDYQQRISRHLLDFASGMDTFDIPNEPPALYSGIRIDFAEGAADATADKTAFQIAGRTTSGPFVIRGHDDFRIELREQDGTELEARKSLYCLIRLDMDRWLSGVTIPGGTSPVVLDTDKQDAARKIQDNVSHSATLMISHTDIP